MQGTRPTHVSPGSAEASGVSARRPLPAELQLLFVGPEEPSWTLLTLQLDREGCTEPCFRWCPDLATAARIVRQDRFDCIVMDDATRPAETSAGFPASLPDSIAALRTGGCLDPVLVLSDRVDDTWLEQMADADCELLVTREGWRCRAVVAWIRKTIERHTVAREREEIGAEGRDRRRRESTETWRQLELLRLSARRLQGIPADAPPAPACSAVDLAAYGDLLRSAVLAGPEQLDCETQTLAAELAARGLSAADLLALHVDAVESLVRGLGGRSAPHVLQRTDLVAMELLVRLADLRTPPRS